MCGGRGGNFSGDTAKAFNDKLAKRPTCAITGKHGKVMNMDIGISVCFFNLVVVYFRKPIVSRDGAGVRKNKSADRICNRTVFLYAPVGNVNIAVYDLAVIKNGGFH